jgi:hypothetical protein
MYILMRIMKSRVLSCDKNTAKRSPKRAWLYTRVIECVPDLVDVVMQFRSQALESVSDAGESTDSAGSRLGSQSLALTLTAASLIVGATLILPSSARLLFVHKG